MNRRTTLTAISTALLLAGLALPAGEAAAQTAKNLVGTWAIVSVENVDASGKRTPGLGDKPRGTLIFTANGRYSLTLMRTGLPKFAANARTKGTADENKAVVEGSIAHVGKYSVDKKDKSFTFHVESSTYPNWDGTMQKRPFSVSGDQLKYNNPASSAGTGLVELVWKRIK